MDVLTNTAMDIRDLLANPDIEDSSTPLSAPDLRLLIDRLQVHSLRIKSKVQSYLLSHHSHFSSLFSQCNETVTRSSHLYTQLSALLSLLSSFGDGDVDRPIESTANGLIKDAVARSKELRLKRELLDLLGVVLELNGKLEDVKKAVGGGSVKEAALGLKDLKKALRLKINDVASAEVGEPVVYGLLREEWAHCFEELQDVLVRAMGDAVQFEQQTNAIRVKHSPSVNGVQVDLPTVLEAMDAVDILDYGLAKVADMIIKHVITPVVNGRSTISIMGEISEYPGNISEAVLQIVPLADDNKFGHVDGETLYSTIINVIKFVNKSLYFHTGPWVRNFGRLTWPRMSELIIANFLSKVVPEDASKLADFQKIVKCTSEFETVLKELMFISSDRKDERLSLFAGNVEVHFAMRKKLAILAESRNLLLESEFILPQYTRTAKSGNQESLPAHTVGLLSSPERCIISDAAFKLMELVHQILKDVCLSSSRVGLEYYHASRDALLLYEAIIPAKLERELDTVNRAALLVHNDCLYLSGEILGLAFEYRSFFPITVKECAVFVDLVPRLQLLGEQVLQKQIQLVMYNIKEAIDGADGFQNTHQVKQYESAKFSMEQVGFILEKVRVIWEPLLLPSIYERCMSTVLEAVFSEITKEILLLDDLAAEETSQLRSLIFVLLENLSPLLESLFGNNRKGKSLHIPLLSLQKLRKLADLMDMSLKSIITAWESGELVRCGFNSLEVTDFIGAIFADSPLRKECLFRIQSLC